MFKLIKKWFFAKEERDVREFILKVGKAADDGAFITCSAGYKISNRNHPEAPCCVHLCNGSAPLFLRVGITGDSLVPVELNKTEKYYLLGKIKELDERERLRIEKEVKAWNDAENEHVNKCIKKLEEWKI